MNLPRALRGILLSSSSTKKCLLRPLSSFVPSSSSPATTTKHKTTQKPLPPPPPPPVIVEWPKPSEIPWQSKVANSIHLIGTIGIPVQLEASPDGTYWGVSVLFQDKTADFPQFWIPIIFEGDLAQSSAFHFKENDLVYVSGQLSGDPPPLTIKHCQTNVQVLVHGISFVQKSHPKQQIHTPSEQSINASASTTKVAESVERMWRDLFKDSQMWKDHRSDKINGVVVANHPDFKHKDTGWGLWLCGAPEWVLSTIEGLKFDVTTPKPKQEKQNTKKVGESFESNWRDLVNNPQMWTDHRSDKTNGVVSAKFPDFKHKGDGRVLWLNSAPEWALSMIGGLKFHVKTPRLEQEKGVHKEEFWKDLVENPNKWWDNRLTKKTPNYPDFRNKDTGEGLWANSCPAWAQPKLPPLKSEQEAFVTKRDTLLS